MILETAVQIPRPDKGSQYRLTTVPFRWTLHSVECDPNADLTNAARTHPTPGQFWYELAPGRIIQSIDTDLAGQALKHNRGTVETNHARAIQVEISGYAADMHHYPIEWFEALGRNLIGPVARHHGISLDNPPTFKVYPASYGANNGVRFTDQQWLDFGGVCGHQHAPASAGNDHGDPGAIPIEAVLQAARPPSTGDDDMTPEQDKMLREVYRQLTDMNFKAGQTPPRAIRNPVGEIHKAVDAEIKP